MKVYCLAVSDHASLVFLILGSSNQISVVVPNNEIMKGLKTCTPFTCAAAPTANGRIAAPVPPIAVAKPIALTCRCWGRSFAQTYERILACTGFVKYVTLLTTIPAGNRGPRNMPRNATATAPTIKFGTSQNRSSRPMERPR